MPRRSSADAMRRILPSIGALIGMAGVVFVTRELVASWDEVREASAGADPLLLLAALMIGATAMLIIGLGWRQWLARLGAPRSPRSALHWYYVGQLGKYVPGGIWPIMGRSEMARRGGIAGGVAYGSTVMSLGMTYLAAILTASLALGVGASGGDQVAWQPVVALLPLGLLALHPRIVRSVLQTIGRLLNRDPGIPVPSWRMSIGLVLWHVPAWLAIGGATTLVAATLDPMPPDVRNILFATTLSWVVGFLVIPAPGGIGVREAVFVAAANSLSSSGVAAAVAVTARVIFILIDLIGAAVTTLLARKRPSPEPGVHSRRKGHR